MTKFKKSEIEEMKRLIKELIKQRVKTKDSEMRVFLFKQIEDGIKLIREKEPGWEPV